MVHTNKFNALRIERGTGMIASSSTFRHHPWRVIRDLLRQLYAVYRAIEGKRSY